MGATAYSRLGRPDLDAVAALMRGFPAPWCFAGGWVIDLILGRATRPHRDIDLAIFREDQMMLRRQLTGWAFKKAVPGGLADWPAGEWLSLPVHEVHVHNPDVPPFGLEFLLNEQEDDQWVFRRNPSVRYPIDALILHSAEGYPVLCPAVVLLYKAKHLKAKDEQDFRSILGTLDDQQRQWLRTALELTHPGHVWLDRLG